MPLLADRVRETTTTVGTGTVTLAGPVTGFQSFNTAFVNGSTVYYVIQYNTEWEIGIGTVGTGTLSRDTVLQSSNADALVPFSAGAKDVFVAYVADRAVTTSDAATLTNKTLDNYTNVVGANHTHFRIKANENLVRGDVVKAVGYNAGQDAIEVVKTVASSDLALGFADAALTTGDFGTAIIIGEIENVNTNGYTVNDIIYSAGSGGFTATKPASGLYQPIGWIVRANASTGVIAINIVTPLTVEASTNTANTVVVRDGSGNFAAGAITAASATVTGTLTTNGTVANLAQSSTSASVTVGTGNGSSSSLLTIRAAAGQYAGLSLNSGVFNRWNIVRDLDPETGSNAGSTFRLNAVDDAGNYLDNVLSITRAAGGTIAFTSARPITSGSITATGNLTASGNLAINGTTLFANGSTNRVGVGTNTPAYTLDVAGDANLSTGSVYRINGTSVLSATALGAGVTASSLTSVGTLAGLTLTGTLQHNGNSANLAQDATLNANVAIGLGSQSGSAALQVRAPAGQPKTVFFRTGLLARWGIDSNNTAETGSNAGSDFRLYSYNDDGSFQEATIQIPRAAGGTIAFAGARPITGGTYNGQTISSAASFTGTLTTAGTSTSLAQSTTSASVNVGTGTGSSFSFLNLRAAAGQYALLSFMSGTTSRWNLFRDLDAETGSNAGSTLRLQAISDAGVFIDTVLSVTRAAGGTIAFATARPITSGPITATSATVTGQFTTTHTSTALSYSSTTSDVYVGNGTGSGNSLLNIRGAAGTAKGVFFTTGASGFRWLIQSNSTAETGSDAGSNFQLGAYGDTGTFSNVLLIGRAAGSAATFYRPIAFGTDNSVDIGASGATRPRNVYIGTSLFAAGNSAIGTTTATTRLTISSLGANGVDIAADTSDATASGRLFFSNGTAGQGNTITNNSGALSFRTGSTAGVSSGTIRMSVKTNGQINFAPLAADPAGAAAGDVYYNSSTNKLKVYNGTSWVDLH